MSLYHKYRPRSLNELVGQEFVRQTLDAGIKSQNLSHAYLFHGSRGTGKTSTARIVAREIILSGVEEEQKDTVLEALKKDSCVDLVEIDGASHRKIEHARALMEKIRFSPSLGKHKVYIIDEVHMLTKEAFNALLKTIEEPPPYVYFLLATTEIHKVPDTIISRCQTFAFQRFTPEQIAGRLLEIAQKEKISVQHEALILIAKKAHGGMRDALSLFEQMAASGDVTVESVQKELGVLGKDLLEDFLILALSQKPQEAIAFVGDIMNQGFSLPDFLEQLLALLREKMLEAAEQNDKRVLQETLEAINLFDSARKNLKNASIPTLPIEMAIVELATRDLASIPTSKRAQNSYQKEAPKKPKKEASNTAPPEDPTIEKKEGVAQEKEEDAAASEILVLTDMSLEEQWPKLLKSVSDATLKICLQQCRAQVTGDKSLLLTFSASSWKEKTEESMRFAELQRLLESIFGPGLEIKLESKTVILEPVEETKKVPTEAEKLKPEDMKDIFSVKS